MIFPETTQNIDFNRLQPGNLIIRLQDVIWL